MASPTSGQGSSEDLRDAKVQQKTAVGRQSKDPNSLKCTLCYDNFKDPRLLDCYHSFCNDCLKYQIEAKNAKSTYSCTLCGAESNVPHNIEEGFPKNLYFIKKDGNAIVKCDVCGEKTRAEFYCFSCEQNFCSFCLRMHSKLQGTKSHQVVTIDEKGDRKVSQGLSLCAQHSSLELKYFCVTCKEPICMDCNMTFHKSHECKNMSEAVVEYKQALENAIEETEHKKFIAKMANEKAQAQKSKNKMLDKEERLLEVIKEQAQLFHKLVDEIQDEYSGQVLEYTPDNSVMKECEKIKLQYHGLYEFSEILLQQGSDIDIILHGTKLVERFKTVKCATVQAPKTDNANLSFVKGLMMKERVRDLFGVLSVANENEEIGSLKLLKRFDCEIEEELVTGITCLDDDKAWVCIGNQGVAKLFDIKGTCLDSFVCDYKLDDIACDGQGNLFFSCNAKKRVIKSNEKAEPKIFLRTKGCARGLAYNQENNALTISLTEKDVFFNCSENPSASMVKMVNMETEKRVMGRNMMKYPARLAINPKENWFVISDWISLQVQLTDSEGNQLYYFDGKSPDCKEELEFIPRGICCDSEGRIYVVNTGDNSVYRLTANGRFDKKLIELDQCWSLACDRKNRLWIGTQNGKMYIFQI